MKSELVTMMGAPHESDAFGKKMDKIVQRIWAGAKRFCKITRTAQMMEHSDIPPPPYTRFTEDVIEDAPVENFNKETGSKTNGSVVTKPNEDAVPKPTGSDNQKPIEKSVVRSTSTSQLELDYSTFSCPRLDQLVRSTVDRVKLLRSILVFIMLTTFHGELHIMDTDTGNLFPWNTTITTRTDAGPFTLFLWDVFEITRDVCTLVRHLEQQIRSNRWFSVRREHKDLLIQLVLEPAEDLKIQADYALEILGTFQQGRGGGWSVYYSTLVDYWKPQRRENLPRLSYPMLDLGDTLASHASLIASLKLKDEQQSRLEDAMATYLETRNLNKLRMSETLKQKVLEELKYSPHGTCCWPMRDGYMDLFRMLGKVDGSRWRDDLKLEREKRRG
ncbi:hypothetical protein SLS60_002631 [Paraconiothyrium brasiliense]|uniref:Uncharacterized protein n=1 Tax=Paraconiothyrium brasiliense TaxID=300254 RepID=A0ABR3RTD0_9PLEO